MIGTAGIFFPCFCITKMYTDAGIILNEVFVTGIDGAYLTIIPCSTPEEDSQVIGKFDQGSYFVGSPDADISHLRSLLPRNRYHTGCPPVRKTLFLDLTSVLAASWGTQCTLTIGAGYTAE